MANPSTRGKNILPLLTCIFLLYLNLQFPAAVHSQQLPGGEVAAASAFNSFAYARAAQLYTGLLERGDNLLYISRLAECYRQISNYDQAEIWYSKLLTLQPENNRARYHYAEILQQNGNFSAAELNFNRFIPQDSSFSKLKALHLISCRTADSLSRVQTFFTIINQRSLNSTYSDFSASIYRDKLVFVSNRPLKNSQVQHGSAPLYGWTGQPYWKIFETNLDSVDAVQEPTLLSPLINTATNNGPAIYNKEGTILYFSRAEVFTYPGSRTKNQHAAGGIIYHNGIFFSRKVNGVWGNPENFPYNRLLSYSISHPALSPDGNTLFFASDMPGGKGGVDLYSSAIHKDGTFGPPQNLGDSINTPGDERFPVIGTDSLLYFSSDGLPGLGGLDIFSSALSKDHWSYPVNLGSPVNSSRDDFTLIFKPGNARQGFFSSNRSGGMGEDDIYAFQYTTPAQRNSDSLEVIHARLLRTAVMDTVKSYLKVNSLDDLAGKTVILPVIYYRSNSWKLDTVARKQVIHLVQLLNLYPAMVIELSSHADITGNVTANRLLSWKRALEIRAYLMDQGILLGRLKARGYGDKVPAAACGHGYPCTVHQNQLNRRTEVKFLHN